MIRRSIESYFFFGTAIRYLQDASVGTEICDGESGWGIRTNLRAVLDSLQELNLKVTQHTNAVGVLRQLFDELQQAKESDVLTQSQASKISACVSNLRSTLEAELRASYAYSLSPKRIEISRLIEDQASLFAPQVFDRLPEIARFDIAEAGGCIAFERPTAAAFHLMRAVEAVLRAFYAATVPTRRRARMWGEITTDLRKRRIGKEHSVLLNHLDHIRTAFRNPTQHPEARYDTHGVQDLWSLSVDAINRMALHL